MPYVTTIAAAEASVQGIEAMLKEETSLKSLQEYHRHAEALETAARTNPGLSDTE
jgi:hypothetical protein